MTQNCANCGTPLTGPYCSNCGQAARDRRGTFTHMLADASEDVLRFDSRFYKSILHLLIKPGYLSKKFIDGKRVAILPPIRMYLVISLLFFIVFDIPSPDVEDSNVYIGDVLIGKDAHEQGKPTFRLISFNTNGTALEQWLDGYLKEKLEPLTDIEPQDVIDAIFDHLNNYVELYLFIFMPIFALLLKILYIFKKVLYFDHLIFSLHFQSWLMLMVLIIYGLAQYNPWWAALSMVLPIYLARAQKVVYNQTYWLVIPKTIFIIFSYVILLSFSALIALMSAITFL